MNVMAPAIDSEIHDFGSTTCSCGPDVQLINGEIEITHKQFNPKIKTYWVARKDYQEGDFIVEEVDS